MRFIFNDSWRLHLNLDCIHELLAGITRTSDFHIVVIPSYYQRNLDVNSPTITNSPFILAPVRTDKSLDIIVNPDDDVCMYYPGGKAKTFHHVVNLIPPHKVYIEPFLGLGSVMKAKRRAETEFGIDLDKRVLQMSDLNEIGVQLIHDDGISFLKNFPFEGHEVVYCDPPYYPKARKRNRVYKFDLAQHDHIRFLEVVTKLNSRIIISGYDNDIYRNYLIDWRVYTYSSKAHDGLRKECLWYNFPSPCQLHDYRYLGSNFRERQTIRRRLERIKRRLGELTDQERSFLLEWLIVREKTGADYDSL